MPILLAKCSLPVRQIDKFAPLHTLKSVVVSPKTDCQSKKMIFLRSSNKSEVVSYTYYRPFLRKIPLGPITDKSAPLSFTC